MTDFITPRAGRTLAAALALSVSATALMAQELRMWTPEEQPERVAIPQQIARATFTKKAIEALA